MSEDSEKDKTGKMSLFNRISHKIFSSIEFISSLLLMLIVILVFVQVISRYIFDQSLGFMAEFSKWAQVWIVFLMLGVIEKRRKHIAVDLLPQALSTNGKSILMVVIDITNFIFSILLFWSGVQTIQNWMLTAFRSSIEWAIPMWIVIICIPLGSVILAIVAGARLIETLRLLVKSLRRWS